MCPVDGVTRRSKKEKKEKKEKRKEKKGGAAAAQEEEEEQVTLALTLTLTQDTGILPPGILLDTHNIITLGLRPR